MKSLTNTINESIAKVKLAKKIIDDVSKSTRDHFTFQSFITERQNKKHSSKRKRK